MEDMRKQIAREPPEGFLAWTAAMLADELGTHGFLYEQEWVDDWGLEILLDEWTTPQKCRMVRVQCSCCGYQDLFHYGRNNQGGYGFILPESFAEVEGGTVYGDRDYILCPNCQERVLVRQKSKIKAKGYFVSAEAHLMSAAVVGPGRLLALTGWTVQRRISENGGDRLVALPAEAYIFSPTDCAQLMGWVSSYSGTAGYFIQYSKSWRQPKNWTEKWGHESHIFGLTPELVAESCLPNCKLDLYMETFSDIRRKYPVAYLRLYQQCPNLENLVVSGLPMVVDDLLAEQMCAAKWEKNKKGLPVLDGINWEERRPAQMLGLTKAELRLGQDQCWGALLWRLFLGAKEQGEQLTSQDIQNAYYLGDESVLRLIGKGPIGKSLRYMLRQYGAIGPGAEDEYGDPDPNAVFDVGTLVDYWDMCERLGRDLMDQQVRWPRDLLVAHDLAAEQARIRKNELLLKDFKRRKKELARYAMEAGGLLIVPAGSQKDLDREAKKLRHCVWTYGEDHATGKTAIFFIRHKEHPRTPYFTLELDEKTLTVKQNRGLRNCQRTPEVQKFEKLWIAWVQEGAPRDAKGKPLLLFDKRKGRVA